MKSYRRSDFHAYTIRFYTRQSEEPCRIDITALSPEDAIVQFNEKVPSMFNDYDVTQIISVREDGKPISKKLLDAINLEYLDECDGGAAVGGDAGGASIGGDAGAVANAGDVAGEMAGTTSAEVLGTNEPGKGFFGKGNFYIPARAKFPMHRWEIANGGSKRKKGKNGKPKKYAYEKGMKVVVDMFKEDENAQKVDKKKMFSKLKNIAKGVKTIDDVNAIEQKFENNKHQTLEKLDNSEFKEAKQLCIDFGSFLKDICTGKYKASWFTITMVAVAIAYLLLPVDAIPDFIPVVGLVDDACVLKLVYDVIKDEFEQWKMMQ